MSREMMLTNALRYLDREGTMSARDVGFFAVGDDRLYRRLLGGSGISPEEYAGTVPVIVGALDQIIAKLTRQRAEIAAGASA